MLRMWSRRGRCCFLSLCRLYPRDMSIVSSKSAVRHLKSMLRRPHSPVPTTRCAGSLGGDLSGLLTLAGRARAELEELQGRQSDTAAQGDHGRRISELSEIVKVLNRLEAADEEREQLQQLQAEPELRQMALEEEQALTQRTQQLTAALEERLAAPPPEDACSAMMEITAGVGGQEAMLFTSELLDMYLHYAAGRGWRPELASCDTTDLGGVRYAAVTVQGSGVYGRLRHEAGVHRVQRVPRTERSGRLHTSTAAVAVLALPEPVQVALPATDLRVETKRASGAGGQHVNTTDSAVRVVHLPTGLAVECQRERSQHRNKERALEILRARLFQAQLDKQQQERNAARRQQVGDSGRAEKVRTYNYPQDRVTDHRCGLSLHGLEAVLSGRRLDAFMDALCEQRRRNTLMERLQEVGPQST